MRILPQTELEVELESGDPGGHFAILVVKCDPELDQLEQVDVGLQQLILVV